MVGWIVDILVGWIVGSVVLGLLFGIGGQTAGQVDVVLGTVLGIYLMRRRRSKAVVTT